RDPTPAEIAYFLATRTGPQMLQLVRAIKDPAAQATLTTALLLAPPIISGRKTTPKKAKKALNAFVGFRCKFQSPFTRSLTNMTAGYYILIPVFKQWPMKKLSGVLSTMWDDDPYKALWSLMTKAWSVIRDQIGKEKAPLDQFFGMACPHLNIPSPETYLGRLGWEFFIDTDGAPSLIRTSTPTLESLDTIVAATTLSVEDIIGHCQSMGYAQEYVFDRNLTSSTFLGHSLGTTVGTNSLNEVTMQTAESVHDGRVAARNKRRAKRQNKRDIRLATILQQEIVDTHT
ncbi:hypothetical protein K469DRAFT_466439, partial [Zopfia rhizophila CBS 207.26]